MLPATPELAALLDSGAPLVMLELLTLYLVGGSVVRFNNTPVTQTWNGETYAPLTWTRDQITLVLGLEVDGYNLTIQPGIYPISAASLDEEDQICGLPWITAVRRGLLYNATAQLDMAYLAETATTITGVLNQFTGQIATPTFEDGLTLAITSALEVLNRPIPAQLYQPGCPYHLYDSNCGLNKAAWAVEGTVSGGSGLQQINNDLAQAAGYFDLGAIEFTSGPNAGQRRTIRTYIPGQINVAGALLAAPALGDSFIAWPGCDRLQSTCVDKFNNYVTVDGVATLRFGGQPNIPQPETAL